jgi:putative restriction endonuclease
LRKGQRLWTREELILTINLYCKTPFGKLHKGNPDVVELSKLIGRTPSSVAYKLVNFASLDPSLKARGIKGAKNVSKLDVKIWEEFYQNWDNLPFESENLRAILLKTSVENLNNLEEVDLPKKGLERERVVKTRVNQNFFRQAVLSAYNFSCCITGLNNPQLLIAGHIKPWAIDKSNRVNPRNGIAINPLHDKAFESGLISISPDYKILISSQLKFKPSKQVELFFLKYENQTIKLPKRFLPDPKFLNFHNNEKFQK